MANRAKSTSVNYFQLVNGRIAKFHKEPIDGVTRAVETKKGVFNFEFFESFEGKLHSVYLYDETFSKGDGTQIDIEKLVIKVKNDDESIDTIEIPFSDQGAQDFIKRIPAIPDIKSPVIVKFFRMKNEEKSKEKGKEIINGYGVIYQNGSKIGSHFEKGDLPEWKQVEKKKNGKKVIEWDNSDYLEALRDVVHRLSSKIREM